jgi:predicted nucleotidyltransferase
MPSIPTYLRTPALGAFCKRNRIARLSLFGSVLTGREKLTSDLDLLVDFEAGTKYGLFDLARMELDLTQMLGRKVDLRTSNELSRHFRDEVLRESKELYAA